MRTATRLFLALLLWAGLAAAAPVFAATATPPAAEVQAAIKFADESPPATREAMMSSVLAPSSWAGKEVA